MTSEATTPSRIKTTNGSDTSARDGLQMAVHEVRGALESVGRSVPDAARASRRSLDAMFKAIDTSSDERLTAGVTLSLGLAIGLLLGGASRLLILATLAPMAAMEFVLQDRRRQASSPRPSAG